MKIVAILITALILSACNLGVEAPYKVITSEYSTWKNDEPFTAKKTILLDNRTGETWFLSYDKNNSTSDGFAWEPLGDAKQK